MLPVFYQDNLVGHIERENAGVSFTYDPAWIEANNAFQISVSMPLTGDEYPGSVATPWFANLLPEGPQLEQIGLLLGRSQGDVYGLLEEVGRETAGALSIGGPETTERADYQELDQKDLAEAIDRLPARPLLAGEEGITMSLAGAQSKLPVACFHQRIMLPLHGAASTHILKPASERLFATVENELLCLHTAAAVGIDVAEATMGIADGRSYLLVKRYDRFLNEPDRVERGHQEDFCQALGIYPTAKYQNSGGPGFADLYGAVDRHMRRPGQNRLKLLDHAVFACCIGDTDRHGKNYSMMLSHGDVRLTPGYDFMSALPYDGITRNLAMKIAGKSRAEHIERRHWERFAETVGLATAATVNRVQELAERVADRVPAVVDDLVDRNPIDRELLHVFAERIRERAQLVASNSRRNSATRSTDDAD